MFLYKKGKKFFSKRMQDAIKNNDKQTLRQLIAGVNLNEIADDDGTTLLYLSIRKKRDKILKFFIKNGCDVNARDKAGATPLLYAIKLANYPAITTLLEVKGNITLSDNEGINVLKCILRSCKKDRLKLIHYFTRHLKECELDIKELALFMQEAKWPIHYAVYMNNLELIRLMLENGCDVNSYDKKTDCLTALEVAVGRTDIEMIKLLLRHGAELDIISYQSKLHRLLEFVITHPSVFETILDYENSLLVRFNNDGKIECFSIFSEASYRIIELLLLKYKINLTTKDRRGNTFLHHLVQNSNRDIIELLLKTNFDVNIRNHLGDTLLHAVIGNKNLSCMKMLIDKGADVNAENNNGDVPLMIAINQSQIKEKELETLIKNGSILDEEMQDRILTMIVEKNITVSIMNPVLKRMAMLYNHHGIAKRNLNLIKSLSNIQFWDNFSMFSKELLLMRYNIITVNSNVSVFEILFASEQKLLNYVRNEEIVKQFAKINSQSIYPIFGKETKTRFLFAIVKQRLIQNAIDILGKNIEQLKCNSNVIENIVKYLSLNDLKCLRVKSSSV